FAMDSDALARAVPAATGAVVVLAGLAQFTRWKSRRLDCCGATPLHRTSRATAGDAWRHGVRLGLDCVACCANLTTVLLVVGVMDIGAMAFVTMAITAERVLPRGRVVARFVGVVVAVGGIMLLRVAAYA